jgi:hypothetical protein
VKKPQKSLTKWLAGDWQTKSGKPSTQGPEATGERFLPKAAIKAMPPAVYAASTAAKRKATKAGKQFSKQPASAAGIAKKFR